MKPPKTAILIAMTDEQAMAVGRMISQWAYFEHMLNQYLAALLKLPECSPLGKNVRMSFEKRMLLWDDVFRLLHTAEPDRSMVAGLRNRTATAHGIRDQVAHGIRWALSDRIDAYKHSNQDLTAKKTPIILSPKRVIALRDEIGALCFELNRFYQRFLISRTLSIASNTATTSLDGS